MNTPEEEDRPTKILEMRQAIDHIEGALMRFGDLVDFPDRWGEPRLPDTVTVTITVSVKQVYDVCDALVECTRIINSDEYTAEALGATNAVVHKGRKAD